MSIIKSAARFASGTMLSRVLGLFRDKCVAHVFGATLIMDAFNIAFRIPNLFRDMLAEGALNSSFTKVYTQTHSQDTNRASGLLGEALIASIAFAILFSLFGILAAPWFVKLMTIFENQERGQDFILYTTNLTRIFFPFMGLMIIGAIITGVLHHRGKFFISAASSSAFNIGYILGALVFSVLAYRYGPQNLVELFGDKAVFGLALGVLLGGLLQVGMQLWGIIPVLRKECRWKIHFPPSKDLLKIFTLMGPIVIAAGAAQINIIINTNFAVQLAPGTVTMLSNAFRLWQLPVALFAVGIGSVALPSLVKVITGAKNADNEKEAKAEVSQKLQQVLAVTGWLMMASTSFIIINAYEISAVIYQSGAYTEQAAQETANILQAYSVGLLFYGLVKVLSSIYVALDRTKYAMFCSLIGIAINIVANALLVEQYGSMGLAFSASIVLGINAALLLYGLFASGFSLFDRVFRRHLFFVLLAVLVCIPMQIFLKNSISPALQSVPMHQVLYWISIAVLNGIFVSFVFILLGMKSYNLTWRSLRSRRR